MYQSMYSRKSVFLNYNVKSLAIDVIGQKVWVEWGHKPHFLYREQ